MGKAKQMLAARHTDGLGGLYLSGDAQYQSEADRPFFGGEVGMEGYSTSWSTGRISLAGYAGDGNGDTGIDAGVRLQTPTRIAPFVGVGTFNGDSKSKVLADRDFRDNDSDRLIDEFGEEKTEYDGWLSSVYPEIGTHFWLNGRWRLTAFGRYFATTEGREHDNWLIGGQLALFSRWLTALEPLSY